MAGSRGSGIDGIDGAEGAEGVEWLEPPSGRLVGWFGLVFVAVMLVLAVVDGLQGKDLPVAAGFCFAAAVIWAVLLRPRVGLGADDLVLRRTLTTVRLPLAAIEQIALRQVLAVLVAEKRYLSTGLGRSRRSLDRPGGRSPRGRAPADAGYAAFVEDRLAARMEEARTRAGVTMLSEEQVALAEGVRTEPAWPVIVALVATAVLWVLGLVF